MDNTSNGRPWIIKRKWISSEESTIWIRKIIDNLEWEQPVVRVYGKRYLTPRLTIFLGNNGVSYSYSGLKHIALGWPKWFLPLLERIRDTSQVDFNGCLLNLYRNGDDHMGWHSDNEIELNPNKLISSLSLGSSRDFYFKQKDKKYKEKLLLNDGDLLLMYPDCQRYWQHSVPKRRKTRNIRVNLTFRAYL